MIENGGGGEEKLNSKFSSSEDAMQNLCIFEIIL